MSKLPGFDGVKGLYLKRGWFYYQPPTPKDGGTGRPKPVALRTRELVAALQALDELRMEYAMERAVTAGTLQEVLPLYYAHRAQDSAATKRARKVVLDAFMEDMGNPRADEITAAMVEKWRAMLASRDRRYGMAAKCGRKQQQRDEREAKHLSGTTIRSYTITLRAFVNWLRQERILRHDPMSRLAKQTRVATTRRHEFLTEDERERALADTLATPDVRLILHLGFLAGLRDAEMLALTPDWIWISEDGQRGTLTVQQTPIRHKDGSLGVWRPKTREMRTVPLHPRLLALLKSHGLQRPFVIAPGKEFWPGETMNSKRYDAKKALHGIAKRAGLPKLNFHIMRHSFATHLAMKGVPLAEIAGLLGDTLSVTEKHYAGFCPNKVNPLEVL
jgi:integrase